MLPRQESRLLISNYADSQRARSVTDASQQCSSAFDRMLPDEKQQCPGKRKTHRDPYCLDTGTLTGRRQRALKPGSKELATRTTWIYLDQLSTSRCLSLVNHSPRQSWSFIYLWFLRTSHCWRVSGVAFTP